MLIDLMPVDIFSMFFCSCAAESVSILPTTTPLHSVRSGSNTELRWRTHSGRAKLQERRSQTHVDANHSQLSASCASQPSRQTQQLDASAVSNTKSQNDGDRPGASGHLFGMRTGGFSVVSSGEKRRYDRETTSITEVPLRCNVRDGKEVCGVYKFVGFYLNSKNSISCCKNKSDC